MENRHFSEISNEEKKPHVNPKNLEKILTYSDCCSRLGTSSGLDLDTSRFTSS
jgi:hypothetical protein